MSTIINETSHNATLRGAELRAAWQELSTTQHVRNRDAAMQLGVSEAELIACTCKNTSPDMPSAVRLREEWQQIIEALPALGTVIALTRNASAVHEKTGVYANIDINGGMGMVLNHDIDLRLFLRRWHIGFAVEEPSRIGLRQSLQFFDRDGTAVHKVYLVKESDVAAYHALRDRFMHEDQSAAQRVEPVARIETTVEDAAIDTHALREGWAALKDTHEFFPLLRRHKAGRVQALRLAGEEFARRVPNDAFRHVLVAAAESGLSIMVFVGSPGVIQIHTGAVKKLKDAGPWFNVLDPGFNLHLREGDIASSWIVRKPTTDGDVTSLELFDANDETIALVFGERKPGRPELRQWRELLARVEKMHA